MEEEEFRKFVNVVYWLWHSGKVGQSTIEAAERIRAHQSNHEAEVSCGGEADLLQHYTRCQKNPGHSLFIPVQNFKKEHLPPGYRDNVIVDCIRSEVDRVCRLSVRHTSENRPTYHPVHKHLLYPFSKDRGGNCMRVGTGWVGTVNKYTEEDNKNCECKDCRNPSTHTPHKVWGEVIIFTAMHVIFNDDEARHTTCHFGYDTSTTWLSDCLKLEGFKVSGSDVIGDWCAMTYVTHDMDIVNKLYKTRCNNEDLWQKMCDEFEPEMKTTLSVPGMSCLTDHQPSPVVIISHPHGRSKHISVGMWTHRRKWSKKERYDEFPDGGKSEREITSYKYNAHTCPGSSGAPVIRLPKKGVSWWFTYHPHSEGGKKNNDSNASAAMYEFVSVPVPRFAIS